MPVTPLSSPPPPPLFFSLLSLSSDFFHPFAKAGVFLCLVPLHLAHFFLPLFSAGNLPHSLQLSPSCFYHRFFFFFFLHPSSFPKTAIPYTREERNLWRVSSARTHFLCLNVPESFLFFFYYIFLSSFPLSVKTAEQARPSGVVMMTWKKNERAPGGQTLDSLNKTNICCIFVVIQFFSLLLFKCLCAIKQSCIFPAESIPSCAQCDSTKTQAVGNSFFFFSHTD